MRPQASTVGSIRAGTPAAQASCATWLPCRAGERRGEDALEVLGAACLTGAGNVEATMAALRCGHSCAGRPSEEAATAGMPARAVRRLRRLPRLALALAEAACGAAGTTHAPRSVFFGTAWGPLSETHEFLAALFASGDRFASPTDFVGSVHNAPAGALAIRHRANGPNVTSTAGGTSFEQALFLASLLARDEDEPMLVGGADEHHAVLSPLVAPTGAGDPPADGGGMLVVRRAGAGRGIRIAPVIPAEREGDDPWAALVRTLDGTESFRSRFAAVLAVGSAAATGSSLEGPGESRMQREFRRGTGFEGPIIDVQRLLGAYATVSAAATVVAVALVRDGAVPAVLAGGRDLPLEGRGILVASRDPRPAAVAVLAPGDEGG